MATTLPNTSGTAASSLPAAGGSSESTLSNWSGPYVTDMLGKAQAISETPYQTYGGPMTAGASDLQNKLFQGLGGLAFPGSYGKSFTETVGNYMNPYLQNVLTPQLEEMRRQSQINLQPSLAKLTQAGGFGGGRQAIMESEANRNLLQEQDKLTGQAMSDAFNKAMGQYNTEQNQGQQMAQTLGNAGETQRSIEQQGITADYNEFLNQRNYPMDQLKFLQSMVQGLPISTVTNTAAQPSALGNLMSTAGGLGTLMTGLSNLGIKA